MLRDKINVCMLKIDIYDIYTILIAIPIDGWNNI